MPATALTRWTIARAVSPDDLARLPDVSPIVVQVLHNRHIHEPDQVRAFIARKVTLHDPFLLKGMSTAVERIGGAILNGERIAVYGDFDADGVTATALLAQTLQALGATVAPYIPDRVDEGYGLNTNALDDLVSRGANLIVTVDCGIRSRAEVAHGNRLGLDIVVTDHHSVGPDLPPALAVINPKQPGCEYPFKGLAGVGVAFKLAQALLESVPALTGDRISLHQEHLLDLVALGTVADIVPLLDENRSLVQLGLAQLSAPRRKGIQALMEKARVKPRSVNSTAIGFMLGPRVNAAGRLKSAMLAYHLLMTRDATRASRYADTLNQLNQERQRLTREATECARAQVVDKAGNVPHLLLAASPDFKAGIVGLVASRLTEEFYRPSVVLEWGEEESRASCRSIPEFHITRALDECADLLMRHGGHAAAAGFAVHNKNLPALQQRLQTIARRELEETELIPTLEIDAELTLGSDVYDLYDQLNRLQPFGKSNPVPIFLSRGLQVGRRQVIGADEQHLKLTVSDGRSWWDAIAFHRGKEADRLPDRIDLAYQLDMNEWNGRKRLQLVVQDWRPASHEQAGKAEGIDQTEPGI